MQRTIGKKASFVGVGLHSGKPAWVTVKSAPADHGFIFRLHDRDGFDEIPATVASVVNTRRSTTIGNGRREIHTVEHILSAIKGLGIDNAVIDIDGPEVPILDGSAHGFVQFLRAGGTRLLRKSQRRLKVLKSHRFQLGEATMEIHPAERFAITATIDFAGTAIGEQTFHFEWDRSAYVNEVAPARTFGFVHEVEALRSQGLINGASLENALVYGPDGCVNPEGPRFEDECVRHKILDIIGDFSLLNGTVQGHLVAYCPGHTINHCFLTDLLAHTEKYRWIAEPAGKIRFDFANQQRVKK